MPLTEEDKDRILVVLRGEVTAKEMVKRLFMTGLGGWEKPPGWQFEPYASTS